MAQNRPKILYVDDESINLEMFQLTFMKDFEVIIAESAAQGLEILGKDHDIKAVISDLRMPYMDGLAFVKAIKSHHKDIPCFLLSGFDVDQEVHQAIQKNLVQDYFMKPFNKIDLQNKVKEEIH